MQEVRKSGGKMKKSKEKKVDEVDPPRMIPTWLQELVQQQKGTDPCFIMTKNLTKTDLDTNENRLLIHAGYVKSHLIPFLSHEEKAAADLLDYENNKRKKPSTGAEDLKEAEPKKLKLAESDCGVLEEQPEGEAAKEEEEEKSKKKKKKKRAGRKHGGLKVAVYVGTNRWKAYVLLTRWDSSNGTVLKGGEYSRYVTKWSGVKKGDKLEMWGFREGEMASPSFALHWDPSN